MNMLEGVQHKVWLETTLEQPWVVEHWEKMESPLLKMQDPREQTKSEDAQADTFYTFCSINMIFYSLPKTLALSYHCRRGGA